jgi:hypothetical protein
VLRLKKNKEVDAFRQKNAGNTVRNFEPDRTQFICSTDPSPARGKNTLPVKFYLTNASKFNILQSIYRKINLNLKPTLFFYVNRHGEAA